MERDWAFGRPHDQPWACMRPQRVAPRCVPHVPGLRYLSRLEIHTTHLPRGAHPLTRAAAATLGGSCHPTRSPQDFKARLAVDVSLAALLGEGVYSFGQLLQHPIACALDGGPQQWLHDMLKVRAQSCTKEGARCHVYSMPWGIR
eukprot:307073-Chlamydomonas_euryale.AAC.5